MSKPNKHMQILGIETTCDETGVAIYDSKRGLLAHALHTQIPLHIPYGGVVPEIASRDHIRKIIPLIKSVMEKAKTTSAAINGIAYAAGPGLIGSLLVGAAVGRSLGYAWQKPVVGVHHMEAHLLAPMLDTVIPFPFIALLVSGGHTLLVTVHNIGRYEILGESLDDSAGEAFDKVAKLLDLSYPGGPAIEKLAETGAKGQFNFPRPMIDRPGFDFSFSGLKTYAANTVRDTELTQQNRANIAHAFQEAVIDTLTIKCKRAVKKTNLKRLVVAGGVSANMTLRRAFQKHIAKTLQCKIFFPRIEFATDNGAMIAYTGCRRLMSGQRDNLMIHATARWPLPLSCDLIAG